MWTLLDVANTVEHQAAGSNSKEYVTRLEHMAAQSAIVLASPDQAVFLLGATIRMNHLQLSRLESSWIATCFPHGTHVTKALPIAVHRTNVLDEPDGVLK